VNPVANHDGAREPDVASFSSLREAESAGGNKLKRKQKMPAAESFPGRAIADSHTRLQCRSGCHLPPYKPPPCNVTIIIKQ